MRVNDRLREEPRPARNPGAGDSRRGAWRAVGAREPGDVFGKNDWLFTAELFL